MIKSSVFGTRQLVLAASAALLCGLTSVSAWADDGLSLGLAVPGLSVFLGNPSAYYAPPRRSITPRPRRHLRVTMWRRCPPEFMALALGYTADRLPGRGGGGMMMGIAE